MKRKKTRNLCPGIDPLQNVVSSLRTETIVKFFSPQLSRHVPSNLFCKYETRILGSDRKYVWYAYENMQEKCFKMLHKNQYRKESKNIMTAFLLCLQKNWLCYQNKDTNYISDKFILLLHHNSERNVKAKQLFPTFSETFEQLIFPSHQSSWKRTANVLQRSLENPISTYNIEIIVH